MSLENTTVEPTTNEVHVAVSDFHVGAGPEFCLRRATSRLKGWPRRKENREYRLVEQKNVLEDFPHDEIFFAFVKKVVAEYGSTNQVYLRLLGDIFDPLGVPWQGQFLESPYENIAVRKIRIIIDGHPHFFDSLAWFIRQPNTHLDFFVGNHDPCLVWPRVQEVILECLAGTDVALRSKIRFFDHRKNFEDLHRGVHYYHGMNVDAYTSLNPKTVMNTHQSGVKLNQPTIIIPYSSYLVVDLLNKIKLRNPLVGRAHSLTLWKNAALYMWGWNIYVIFSLIAAFFNKTTAAAIGERGWRRVMIMIRMMIETISDDTVDRLDNESLVLLRNRKDIQVVVRGHSHVSRLISIKEGTYVNTGTWVKLYREKELIGPLIWKRTLAFLLAMMALLLVLFLNDDNLRLSIQVLSIHRVLLGFFVSFFSGVLFLKILGMKPTFVPHSEFTCAIIRHEGNDSPKVGLFEYFPSEDRFRERL